MSPLTPSPASLSQPTYGISVDNISVTYSNAKLALYNASCYVQPGTITGLVGPNGGGKSTLFKSIMGFLAPSQGQIQIDNLSIKKAQKQQLIAYVPQADEVDWNFPISVYDVVMMGRYGYMNIFRIPSRKDRRIVMESLARVGMGEFKDRQIGELSGGQKKRAFLARALAQEGRVILLDEPFTGVDVKTEKSIIQLLLQLRREGHTVLVSTHDLASISTFCDRVILLNQTILAAGTTADTFTEENLTMTFGGLPISSLPANINNQPTQHNSSANNLSTNNPSADELLADGLLANRATTQNPQSGHLQPLKMPAVNPVVHMGNYHNR